MTIAGVPDEAARLAALRDLGLLDTGPESGFDDLVEVARVLAGTPVALVSLIDAERQWFKARVGLDAAETPRSVAFCDHAIRGHDVLVVPDATRDPRFANNPLVTGDPFIRFYAGAPIRTPEGHAIGTVCVIDTAPRDRFDQAPALAALARQAAALIEFRRMARIDAAVRADVLRDHDRLWTLTHDLMLVCDLDGTVMSANPAWQAVFGPLFAPGAMEMRDFLVDPSARPRLREIPNGGAVPFTTDYYGADRAIRSISWTLRREGELIYAIGRDDTALRIAEADLLQAQKMESLGQLTGGIAHDFNNLLTIIVGNLDIAGRRLKTGDVPRVERALAEAGEGANRAATLTQRLLAFARRQRLAPRAVDLAGLIADMRPLVEHAASEAIAIEMFSEAGVWPVEIDVNQLENAILNLVVNARDAMAGGDLATLLIGLGNLVVDAAEAGRHGVPPGDFVRLTVADTGTGMTEEVRARAFEPFFTTKGVGRGTGLGLSQVHGFVRQSGGFVTIDTRPGEGTGVHLWLPRTASEPAGAPPVREPAIEANPRAACVMVVEDNDALRELVVETLRDAGYKVIEAHDGRSALTLFARQSPPPDIVVSDVMMPRLDGFALADELLARAPATRVLLMSGYAGADTSERAGREPLLVKPFTPDALLERVRALLIV
ncbi:response regulator [Sphingomonas sp. CGMCC 1.13654]|uniref:histidine kinase n=1 Tax=Sphingomonas chungangi TaxID=2683589 RepID=A0A838LD58_9SPHN|nr:response regulator [Sphingomonas chungangi]